MNDTVTIDPAGSKPPRREALDMIPSLGMIARDIGTGFVGRLTTKAEMLSGNVQFGMQPQCDDEATTIPDAQFVDLHLLEVLDAGIHAQLTPAAETPYLLGQEFKDRVTGFKGIATEKLTFLNGCVYFNLVAKAKANTGEPGKGSIFEHKRLDLVGNGVLPKPVAPKAKPAQQQTAAPPAATPAVRRPPGGPIRSAATVLRGIRG